MGSEMDETILRPQWNSQYFGPETHTIAKLKESFPLSSHLPQTDYWPGTPGVHRSMEEGYSSLTRRERTCLLS
ncbi:hypothetical protein LEMLEM_LOCUS24061, partial [Lemmus lemmus]